MMQFYLMKSQQIQSHSHFNKKAGVTIVVKQMMSESYLKTQENRSQENYSNSTIMNLLS